MAMLHSNRALIDCNSPGNKKRITGNQSFLNEYKWRECESIK